MVAPGGLADWLMGRGRHFVTTGDAAELLGVAPGVVWSSLDRARQAGKMVSVTKGGWVPVPPEYRNAGAPPPVHYIDQMMNHLGHAYYVGFLSAACFYGAEQTLAVVASEGSVHGVGCFPPVEFAGHGVEVVLDDR